MTAPSEDNELDSVLGVKPDVQTQLDYYFLSFDGIESASIHGSTLKELKRRINDHTALHTAQARLDEARLNRRVIAKLYDDSDVWKAMTHHIALLQAEVSKLQGDPGQPSDGKHI